MKYVKELDSLRAFAVALVIASHWIPKLNVLPWGEVGVDIFFVLSGFLISSILVENKIADDQIKANHATTIKRFIIRRTLRIFPIYYLAVGIHFLIADSTGTTVRENIGYYLMYASNILYFKTGQLDGIASHFWSLAVEEQFYLIWPWIILFVPAKQLTRVMWSFVAVGMVFPILIGGNSLFLMPACVIGFAFGALLAHAHIRKYEFGKNEVLALNLLTIASVLIMAAYPVLKGILPFNFSIRLPVSIITVWLIRYCLYDQGIGVLTWVLQQRLLIFIGKISYGIYIYHTMIPWLWRTTQSKLDIDIHQLYVLVPKFLHNDIDVILKLFLLVGLSWLSWILIETPINGLKRLFEYRAGDKHTPQQGLKGV